MAKKKEWFWIGDHEHFRGFTNLVPVSVGEQLWSGPFRTFSEAKADALNYYRMVARGAHAIAGEIKAERKP